MKRFLTFTVCLLLFTAAGSAAEYGTADEAKALLQRAIAEVQADGTAALAKFNSGEDGYKDRDLYVFCFDTESGLINAHPTLVGTPIVDVKDKTGFALGQEMHDSATEGVISEIEYLWPRPNETEPVKKHSFYTRVGDLGCGVGYYE